MLLFFFTLSLVFLQLYSRKKENKKNTPIHPSIHPTLKLQTIFCYLQNTHKKLSLYTFHQEITSDSCTSSLLQSGSLRYKRKKRKKTQIIRKLNSHFVHIYKKPKQVCYISTLRLLWGAGPQVGGSLNMVQHGSSSLLSLEQSQSGRGSRS